MPIFWCHGFGGDPETSEKVRWLRDAFPEVYAYKIDIDPAISIPKMCELIDQHLDGLRIADAQPIMVGNSLGGWYAAELADCYSCRAVLINPSWNPSGSLAKYGVPEDVRKRYGPMKWIEHAKYFIGDSDDVIDFEPVKDILTRLDVEWIQGAGHDFGKAEFERVVAHIKSVTCQKQ